MSPLRLSVVAFPETTKTWTARALEHDLAAHARTVEGAVETLVSILRAHAAYDRRHGREPLSAFAAAPLRYWDAFEGAKRLSRPCELASHGEEGPMLVVTTTISYHPRHGRRHPTALSA